MADSSPPEEEDESLLCSICTSLLVEPVSTPCGHSFCKEHLSQWIVAHPEAPSCPLDRLPIQRTAAELRVNVALKGVVERERRRRGEQQLSALDIPWGQVKFTRDADGERVELGSGVAGTVYQCEYSFQLCAIKQLRPALCASAALIKAARAEAALQRSMAHEGIVPVLGMAVDASDAARPKYGILMALMWRDLQGVLAGASEGGDAAAALPLAWRLRALHQVSAGLAHLHGKKVAHGDLKPLNVMLAPRERGCAAQLSDFGFSRVSAAGAGGGSVLEGGALAGRGTVRWMAPELLVPPAEGRVVAPGAQTDVYALAVLGFQLLACAPDPYPGLSDPQVTLAVTGGRRPNLALLPPEVPGALTDLLKASWSAQRAARPYNAGAFLERLRACAPDPGPSFPQFLFPPGTAPAGSGSGSGGSGAAAIGAAPRVAPAAALLPWTPRAPTGAECPVCSRSDAECPALPLRCRRAHSLCMECALRTLRDELKPTSACIRCPVCRAEEPMNAPPRPVDLGAMLELAAWSRGSARSGAHGALRPLADEDLLRVREISARSAAAAAAAAAPAPEVPPHAHLFKRCPGCGTGVQKPRGHHCHHISPGTGCTNCGVHFCYVCLRAHKVGESHNVCPTGCPLFCSDDACNCMDCLDCSPGRPCDECSDDGRCWVCHPERRPAGRVAGGGVAAAPAAPTAPTAPAAPAPASPARAPAPPARAPAPPPARSAATTWVCMACTFENEGQAGRVCSMCDTPRAAPAAAPAAAPRAAPAAAPTTAPRAAPISAPAAAPSPSQQRRPPGQPPLGTAAAPAPAVGGVPSAVGQSVKMRDGVTPLHDWGSVRAGMVGRVTAILGAGNLRVDFPGVQTNWTGVAQEMVVVAGAAARPTVGSRVRLSPQCSVVDGCLGRQSDRRVGTLVVDDGTPLLPFKVRCEGFDDHWYAENAIEVVAGASAAAAVPAAVRPAVGSSVRLTQRCSVVIGCLGRQSDRRVGTLVVDDGSPNLPFKVACLGVDHWYAENAIEVADSAAALRSPRHAVGSIVRSTAAARATSCLGAPGSGRTGVLLFDDHTDLPYLVQVPGVGESWYTPEALESVRAPAPLDFAVHVGGQWRDVKLKRVFTAPDDAAGVAITVYCSFAASAREGARCQHGASERCIEANHWSCCGARDRGAAVCALPHAHQLVPQEAKPSRRCGRCRRTGVPGTWRGCHANACNYDECSECYAWRPAELRTRDAAGSSARLPVGTVVRAAASAPAGACLGARGSSARGKVVEDDGSSRPYKVQLLDGSDYDWYSARDIERA